MKCRDCAHLGWGDDEGTPAWGLCFQRTSYPDPDIDRSCSDFSPKKSDIFTILSMLQTENEHLRAELERVKAEKDAAIEDLEEIMFKGGHNIDTCHFCTNGQCYGRGGTQVCEPKWRGQKED